MTRISGLLFDLGNVMFTIHPERFASTLGLTPQAKYERVRPAVMDLVRRYERGETGTRDFFDEMGALFGGQFPRRRLEEAMENIIGEAVPGMEELVRTLLPSFRIAAVSNTSEFHIRHCDRLFPHLRSFPARFLSYELGRLKPEREFYQIVLEGMKIPAEEMLFIDDLKENTQAAEEAGMNAVRFTDCENLGSQIRALLKGAIENRA